MSERNRPNYASRSAQSFSTQALKSQFPGADIEFADVATLFPVDVETDGYQANRSAGRSPVRNTSTRNRRYDF